MSNGQPNSAPTSNRAINRWVVASAVGFLILILGLNLLLSTTINTRDDQTALEAESVERIQHAEMATCHRVQILRDQVNGNTLDIYDFLRGSQQRQEKLLAAADDPAQRETYKQGRDSVKQLADKTLVTGPTDCKRAVADPDHYRAPAPQFVRSHSAPVTLARERAEAIREKAKTGKALELPTPPPAPPGK